MASKKCAPMSSCQNGQVHPPWVKPPSVSSSAPPGACMTLSNDTNSETMIFRIISSILDESNLLLIRLVVQSNHSRRKSLRFDQFQLLPFLDILKERFSTPK